jgi:DNA-binding HxlR family transcriptional regulator
MWQVVSDIGVLQVIAICKRRQRTARERWWQSCKYHLRHGDASGQRTSLGRPINAAVEVIGDRWSLLVLGVDLRGGAIPG